jgi:multicopper oxidase
MTNGLLTRRGFLVTAGVVAAGGATAAVLARTTGGERALEKIGPTDGLIGALERQRRRAGAGVKEIELHPLPGSVALGNETVNSWSYDGLIPGSEVRLSAGDVLRATVRNGLPDPTTIHWHGIALRNDMDGVPDLTQQAIAPGAAFTYEFTAPDPGTYFFHPHVGTQLDRGLYAPLVVEDPSEPGAYDREFVVVLDDWLGSRRTPDDVLETLQEGMGGMSGTGGMGGMDMGGGEAEPSGGPLGGDTGDVRYPMYLINGRPATDPATFPAKPGERLRLRIINAGSDTPFRVALGGHRLTVTHADGFPVEPIEVDALLLGMGERYDVLVRVPDSGAFPLFARAEGTAMGAMAVVRTGIGMAPMADVGPKELMGQLLGLFDLRATEDVALPSREPDRTYTATLTGDMASYRWGVQAESEGGVTLPVRSGERVRLVLDNSTMMWHPLHLHGHTFQAVTGAGSGPRKDTVIVPAGSRITLDIEADNPGQWVLHCHNIYHAESGMLTVLSYVS